MNLKLDPTYHYGGEIDASNLTLRKPTASEASSLSPSTPDSIVLYESYINSGLRIPLTPLVSGILSHFDIAPCQVNANFYRAISAATAAIPFLQPGLSLTPELFVNCYKLRKSEKSWFWLSLRHKNVAGPGGSLPSSDKTWAKRLFVATGQWWGTCDVRSAPNLNVDPKKPPPPLAGNDAVAFELLRRGNNPKFEELLKTAHKRKGTGGISRGAERDDSPKRTKVAEGEDSSSSDEEEMEASKGELKRDFINLDSSEDEDNQPLIFRKRKMKTASSDASDSEISRAHSNQPTTHPTEISSTVASVTQAAKFEGDPSSANPIQGSDFKPDENHDSDIMSPETCILKAFNHFRRLEEENTQLKSEVEALKIPLKMKMELEDHIATSCIHLQKEKDDLFQLLENSKKEVASKNSVIKELQSYTENLADTLNLAEQAAEADIDAARQAGYNDGFIDGKKKARQEFVELQQKRSSS